MRASALLSRRVLYCRPRFSCIRRYGLNGPGVKFSTVPYLNEIGREAGKDVLDNGTVVMFGRTLDLIVCETSQVM